MSLKVPSSKPATPRRGPPRGKVPEDGVMDTTEQAGTVEMSVGVKKDRTSDYETVKQRSGPAENPAPGPKLARARSGYAITLSFDYQSVRVEASVELPCGTSEEEIKAAHVLGYRIASESMKPEIQDAKQFLAGGKAEIFGE